MRKTIVNYRRQARDWDPESLGVGRNPENNLTCFERGPCLQRPAFFIHVVHYHCLNSLVSLVRRAGLCVR